MIFNKNNNFYFSTLKHYFFPVDPTYSDFFDSNGNKVKISRYQLRFDTVSLFRNLKVIIKNKLFKYEVIKIISFIL